MIFQVNTHHIFLSIFVQYCIIFFDKRQNMYYHDRIKFLQFFIAIPIQYIFFTLFGKK